MSKAKQKLPNGQRQKTRSVAIEDDLYNKIEAAADAEERPVSFWIRKACVARLGALKAAETRRARASAIAQR